MGKLVRWILFLVVLVIFTSGAIAVYTVFVKPDRKAAVPSFRGNSVLDATAEAEKLGLVVQVEPVASTLSEGRVLAQSPEAGQQLRKGQVIVLQISRGGKLHAVPDVRGKTLEKAQEEIKAQGFAAGDVVRINNAGSQAGTVIAQSPAAPANTVAGRKIDLLIQDGAGIATDVTVPDVNRKSEKEARSILAEAGVKVQAVDKVYSPLLSEGTAIETRPVAGSRIKPDQGVILKLATQRRPAGFMEADTKTAQGTQANTSVRRVTNAAPTQTEEPKTQTAQTPRSTKASLAAREDDVFIGDSSTPAPARTVAQNQPAAQTRPAAQPQQVQASEGSKTARIRYQVPPIAKPMNLRIEITDPSGKRDVLNRQVRSGESINTSAKYTQECVISIYLGGESVWQEKQR